MCLTPNLIYVNKLLADKKHPHGVFFYQFSQNNLEMVRELKKTLKGNYYRTPCGKCIECQLQKSHEWAIRAYMEYLENPIAYFITLTYENAPKSLKRQDFDNFIKKLRNDNPTKKLKYLASAEYGSQNMRSHFHLILYGLPLNDLKPSTKIYNDEFNKPIYESDYINKIWNKGIVAIDMVSKENCRYVAGYVDKKQNKDFYKQFNIKQPFKMFSKGLGEKYIKKHLNEIYTTDKIYLKDTYITPIRYSDNILKKENLKLYNIIKKNRQYNGEQKNETLLTDYQTFKIYNKNKENNLKEKFNTLKRK